MEGLRPSQVTRTTNATACFAEPARAASDCPRHAGLSLAIQHYRQNWTGIASVVIRLTARGKALQGHIEVLSGSFGTPLDTICFEAEASGLAGQQCQVHLCDTLVGVSCPQYIEPALTNSSCRLPRAWSACLCTYRTKRQRWQKLAAGCCVKLMGGVAYNLTVEFQCNQLPQRVFHAHGRTG